MKTLNNHQLQYIKSDLKSRKIASGFKPELLDHVCCMVEGYLNTDHDFSTAYAKALTDFSDQGFIELKNQSPVVKKKRKMLASQLAGATVAASILMMVFNLGAQDAPEISPIDDYDRISSAFGLRIDPRHKEQRHRHRGVDFKCKIGTPIKSTAKGIVVSVEVHEGGYGKKIEVQHDEHYTTRYAHLSEIQVVEGQVVKLGEVIGLAGESGIATGPHLHYEVIKDGQPVDPAQYMALQK